MRKLLICAAALTLLGCSSEYDIREVRKQTDEDNREVYTVDGDRINGTVVEKTAEGVIRASIEVKDGLMNGEVFADQDGKPKLRATYANGYPVGSYKQFCKNGEPEIVREITSWPLTYTEQTFSCDAGHQLTQKQMKDGKAFGEQIRWRVSKGKQELIEKQSFNAEGNLHGEHILYGKEDRPTSLKTYKNGVLDGPYAEYDYATGAVQSKGMYKDGKMVGLWEEADSNILVGNDLVNPDSTSKQMLMALGVNPSYVFYNLEQAWKTREYAHDFKRAEFFIEKGQVDLSKPFSVNTVSDNARARRSNQEIHRFVPITNMVHEEVFDWVIERGADVNAVDFSGKNRLLKCLEHGYCSPEHVAKLVEMSDIKIADKDGRTALHMACQPMSTRYAEERAAQRKVVLEKGDVNQQDKFGWTPLHYCLSSGFMDSARQLVARGADMTLKNNAGDTPAQMVWLRTQPYEGARYEALWDEDRISLASELQKAGKISFHTQLPGFDQSIRDLAMRNGDIELVERIDAVEPL